MLPWMKDLMGSRCGVELMDEESNLASPMPWGAVREGLEIRVRVSSWGSWELTEGGLLLHEEKGDAIV